VIVWDEAEGTGNLMKSYCSLVIAYLTVRVLLTNWIAADLDSAHRYSNDLAVGFVKRMKRMFSYLRVR
jgi:hypothetical protein